MCCLVLGGSPRTTEASALFLYTVYYSDTSKVVSEQLNLSGPDGLILNRRPVSQERGEEPSVQKKTIDVQLIHK